MQRGAWGCPGQAPAGADSEKPHAGLSAAGVQHTGRTPGTAAWVAGAGAVTGYGLGGLQPGGVGCSC